MIRPMAIGFIVACAAGFVYAAEPLVLDVWPGKVPGETGDIGPEKWQEPRPGQREVKRLTNVTKPTITVYRPAKEKDTGVAVVIAPGGGYSILAMDLEGTEVAESLNSIGVTGIVLKYRVPKRASDAKDKAPLGPLQDAQRAVSLVRSKAGEWGIDPKRIGFLGFSAGGHLTGAVATNYDRRAYDKIDDVDEVSCRPDFAVLGYPAYLIKDGTSELRPDIRVSKETPPCFFFVAADDKLRDNSINMFVALRKAGVPAELHVYEGGGHGFGLRPSGHTSCTWPKACEAWMRAEGVLKKEAVR